MTLRVLNYPSLNYIRFGDAHHALSDAQMPEQFDSVTALTWAMFYDEWGEVQPFEVIKQRKVGRCMAVCQSFSSGGGHMIANVWWLWSCSQTNGQIKREINTSGHKSKFAPASVYKLPAIKDEHLAYIWHAALRAQAVTCEGRSPRWGFLVTQAGKNSTTGRSAVSSLSTS